jgi:hypothetical protein
MTTFIGLHTNVVKLDDKACVDNRRATVHDPGMDTLAKRLEWVVEQGLGGITSAEDWAKRAGLSRQIIWAAINRNGSMKLDKAAQLADVAGVDLYWLATGRGSHLRATAPETDPYPSRMAAVLRLRKTVPANLIRWIEEAASWVRWSAQFNSDAYVTKTAAFWERTVLSKALELAAAARESKRDVVVEEESPSTARSQAVANRNAEKKMVG